MKKLICLSLVLVLVLGLVAVASASIDGNRQERKDLATANQGGHQIVGDIDGVFTAALNQTQPIYGVYNWNQIWFELGDVIGSGNGVVITLPTIPAPKPVEKPPEKIEVESGLYK